MGKYYAAIDLKSFYASVECCERGLDPLTTNLVVADASRTDKTICLAISPSLKSKYHLPGRARLFEVKQRVKEDFIIARPRMSHYMNYSQKIYQIYLQHIAPEDIFAYSIDEVFCDLTSYLKMSGLSAEAYVAKILTHVYNDTGITATAGIGTNLFLAKVAMDIVAKHATPNAAGVRIASLDEISFRTQLWAHQPITDFWRIGPGYAKQLAKHQMYTLGDVARCSLINEDLLYQLFGVNAELLIDHAWGYEPTTIAAIKHYQPRTKSICSGQVLSTPYNFTKARLIVKEMADELAFNLIDKQLETNQLTLHVSYDRSSLNLAKNQLTAKDLKLDRYGRQVPKSAHGSFALGDYTASSKILMDAFLRVYDQYVNPEFTIRRLNLSVNNLVSVLDTSHSRYEQLSLFLNHPKKRGKLLRENRLQKAILAIRKRYGKNSILRGLNFEEGATAMKRNHQIGGHQA